jgi:GT2 family glycosyltransferase
MDFTFDVLIASYDRSEILKTCLKSIELSKSKYLVKVIVLTQREDLETIEIIKLFSHSLPVVPLIVDKKIPPGASRNYLVQNSTSKFLQFLDDDAFLPEHYYSEFFKFIETQPFDILGGPDQSPIDGSLQQKVLGKILEASFVMGPTSKRHSIKSEVLLNASEVDLTLCNLWIKRDIFIKGNHCFDENILRCEENLFLEQLQQSKYKMLYVPQLYVFHKRRDHLIDLAKIQFKSGYYRGITFFLDRNTFKNFFMFPILTGFLLTVFPYLPETLQLGLILLHSVLAIVISLNVMVELKSVKSFFLSWLMIIIVHFFFSVGIFFGSVKGRIKNV